MSNKDTLLIFQNPNLYFFPHYQDIIFKPYDISEKSLLYIIYRLLYYCRIPFCSCFWGKWKNYISNANQVIIFDYGYQRGMEKYIHKKNPNCKVFLFLWNKIDAAHNNHTLFTDKSAIYSTDPEDCKKYNLKYNHIFYPIEYTKESFKENNNRIFFLGADKNRSSLIQSLKQLFVQSGLDCDVHILSQNTDAKYKKQFSDILTTQSLSYEEYLAKVESCGILLDIVQTGQQALTMRVLESVFLSKKLITNNPSVKKHAFFHSGNILVLPETINESLIPTIKEFIQKPFTPYDMELLTCYDFHHWLTNFDV